MYKRILVGTDGSKTAAKAVARAVAVAGATGADLTIATVGRGDGARKIVDAALATHAAPGARVSGLVREGDPATELADLAESGGYDLLVVGNKGMTGVSRFLLGSVPNKISHHAPCSLLIVHTT